MKKLDESLASSDELYDWCMKEYNNRNPMINYLITRFYKKIELIIEQIKPDITNVLEIGCGAGESALRLKRMLEGINFDASEYDLRYIEAIKKRNIPLNVFQENVYDIRKPDDSYDCIIMLEVLEHLENIQKAVAELFRVTKKYLIISVPYEPIWRISNIMRGKYINKFGNTPGHLNHFNKKKLTNLFSSFSLKPQFYTSLPWIICVVEKI